MTEAQVHERTGESPNPEDLIAGPAKPLEEDPPQEAPIPTMDQALGENGLLMLSQALNTLILWSIDSYICPLHPMKAEQRRTLDGSAMQCLSLAFAKFDFHPAWLYPINLATVISSMSVKDATERQVIYVTRQLEAESQKAKAEAKIAEIKLQIEKAKAKTAKAESKAEEEREKADAYNPPNPPEPKARKGATPPKSEAP